jgi:hypothetical protein
MYPHSPHPKRPGVSTGAVGNSGIARVPGRFIRQAV